MVNHPETMLELETGRDPMRPIVDLKFSFDRAMESTLEDQGYEIVENVDVSALVWGPTLGKHKRCLLWKYCLKIEKTEYVPAMNARCATKLSSSSCSSCFSLRAIGWDGTRGFLTFLAII